MSKMINDIKDTGINYLWHEALAWNRAMDFYLQENAFFKTRLAQVIENKVNKEFIEKAEHFQNCFVQKDECVKDLKLDIDNLQRSLRDLIAAKKTSDNELAKKFNKLKNEIDYFNQDFEKLKLTFNQYLVSFIGKA
jgi:hypothetical protein